MKSITAVCAGLFIAWAAHDTEELVTMSASSRRVLARTPHALPVPHDLRTRGLSQAHVNLSIALMAVPVAAAAVSGARTQGRSSFFRGALLAFGLHGFSHLGHCVAMRGYTTGAATAPVIVIPYWLVARRILHRSGQVDIDRSTAGAAVAVLPITVGAHLAAAALLGERSLGGFADSISCEEWWRA